MTKQEARERRERVRPVVPPASVRRAAERRLAAVKDYYGMPDAVRLYWVCDDFEAAQGARGVRDAGWTSDDHPLTIYLDGWGGAYLWPRIPAKRPHSVQRVVTHEAVHIMQHLRDGPDAHLNAVLANGGRWGRHDARPWEREAEAEARAFVRNRRNQRVRDRRDRQAGRSPRRPVWAWATECLRRETERALAAKEWAAMQAEAERAIRAYVAAHPDRPFVWEECVKEGAGKAAS